MTDTPKPLGQANYESFARRYAQHAPTKGHNAHYERPATLSLLPDVRGLRVLDAGCGPGIVAEWLVDRGARVVAFDVTPEMIEITRERLGDRITALCANLEEPLTFADDASFDLIVCSLALDYVRDWTPTFREFAHTLAPGGLLVFSAGHPGADLEYCRDRLGLDVDYFATEEFACKWSGFGEPRPLVRSYRRPWEAVLNPLVEAGLVLDRILEPQPTPAFAQEDPEGYAMLMSAPGFVCVRAKKPG